MTRPELLLELRRKRIRLYLDGEALSFDAPVGAMTASLRKQIADRRDEITTYLRQAEPDIRLYLEPEDGAQKSGDVGPPLRLSPGQEALWVWSQLYPDDPSYNVCLALRFSRGARSAEIQRALARLVERHAILRTVYRRGTTGQPVQHHVSESRVELSTVGSDSDEETQELITSFGDRPFDLAAAPPFRALLIQERESVVLCLVTHHIATDGQSQNIVAAELAELHEAIKDRRPGRLGPVLAGYSDVAVAARSELDPNGMQYWIGTLAGAKPTMLPMVTAEVRERLPAGRRLVDYLDLETTSSLRKIALRRRASLFPVIAASFALATARICETNDVVFGTAFSSRGRDTDTVGYFIDTVTIRTKIEASMTWDQLLKQVQATVTDAYRYKSVPLSKIVAELRPVRTSRQVPLYQIKLLHNPELPHQVALPEGVSRLAVDRVASRTGLLLRTSEVDGRLKIEATFPDETFVPGTVENLVTGFKQAARRFIDDSDASCVYW